MVKRQRMLTRLRLARAFQARPRSVPDLRFFAAGTRRDFMRTKAGKVTLCAMPCKWRDVEEPAASMSKVPDVEQFSVAAYGRIIASFKGGVRIDLEAP